MTFNSTTYFLFLPFVFIVFYLCGGRWRWQILLLASFIFYSALAVPWLPFVLGFVILITYFVGIGIHTCPSEKRKTLYLWFGIGANILILASLKYLPSVVSIRLPVAVGLSYYVFQAISYLADVNKKIIEPERHLGYFALYLSFFPKLLQGPIERANDLLPQLKQPYAFDYDMARSGLLLFTWGLFKKIVVADRLALFVNPVFGDVYSFQGIPLILATYFYTLQIYMDFSAYTDMALGSARLFNIRLTQNFNSPYLSTSVSEFWRRWHITLSNFLRDYLYIPLGGSRYGSARRTINLMITMLLCGIWHGAGWSFVVWGGIHGLFLVAGVYYRPLKNKLHSFIGWDKSVFLKAWQTFFTFNLIAFAWIFFRANDLKDSIYVVGNLFNGIIEPLQTIYKYDTLKNVLILTPGEDELAILLLSLPLYFVFNAIHSKIENGMACNWKVYAYTVVMISFLIIFGVTKNSLPFIYFKF